MSRIFTSLSINSVASDLTATPTDFGIVGGNKAEYGVLTADFKATGAPIAAGTTFQATLPTAEKKEYNNVKCFLKFAGKEEMDHLNVATRAETAEFVVSGTIKDKQEKDFGLVCGFSFPSVDVEQAAKFQLAEEAAVQTNVKTTGTIVAKEVKVSGSGDKTKPGFTVELSKVANANKDFKVSSLYNNNIQVLATGKDVCQLKINDAGSDIKVLVQNNVASFTIPADKAVKAEDNVKVECGEDSNVIFYSPIRGPSMVSVGSYSEGALTVASFAEGKMANGAFSFGTGVAAIAVVASAMAYFL